jgi:hypothetical protein
VAWEPPANDPVTRAAQAARALSAAKCAQDEAAMAAGWTEILPMYAQWSREFDEGGHLECKNSGLATGKNSSGFSFRLAVAKEEWCAAAVHGPGGALTPSAYNRSQGNTQSGGPLPLGTWCALPESGRFAHGIAATS